MFKENSTTQKNLETRESNSTINFHLFQVDVLSSEKKTQQKNQIQEVASRITCQLSIVHESHKKQSKQ